MQLILPTLNVTVSQAEAQMMSGQFTGIRFIFAILSIIFLRGLHEGEELLITAVK